MALFKISKGSSSDLLTSSASRYAKEGSAWFTPDDGKFYIDIAGDGTSSSPAVLSGTGRNRIVLNADTADRTAAALLIKSGQKNGTFVNESRFDGSQETLLRLGHSIYYVEGNTTGNAGAWTGTLPNNVTPTDGFTIAYKVGVPGAAMTTLALSNGVQTLTHTVYGGLSVPVGTTILLVYSTVSSTGRWSVANTDEKVKITSSSTNAEYPILASAASSITSGNAYNALYKSGVTINPSTGIITATKLKGELYNSLRLDVGESYYDDSIGAFNNTEVNTYTFDNTDAVIASIDASSVGALSLRFGGTVDGVTTFTQSINADITGNASTADSAAGADALNTPINIYYYDSESYQKTAVTGIDGSGDVTLDFTGLHLDASQVDNVITTWNVDDYVSARLVNLVLIPTDNSNPLAGGTAMLYQESWGTLLWAVLTGRTIFGQVLSGSSVSDLVSNVFHLSHTDCVNHSITLTTYNSDIHCEVTLTDDGNDGMTGTYTVTPPYTHPSYQAETAGAYLIGRDNQGHVTFGGSITPTIIGAVDKSGDYMTGHLTLAGATNTGLGNCTTMLKFATAAAPTTAVSQITANDSGFIAFSKGSSYTDSNAIGYDGTRNAFRPTGTNTTASLGTSTNPFANVYATNLHGTADQVANNLVITLDGGTTEGSDKFTYNGYTTKTINITAANTGAALLNHDHDNDYVPLSRTVNSKSLSSDITLTYSDVGAAPTAHTHGNITSDGKLNVDNANTLDKGKILYSDSTSGKIVGGLPSDVGAVDAAEFNTYKSHTHDDRYIKITDIGNYAEMNQNAFSTIAATVGVTTTNMVADSKTDTFTIIAGDNITLEPNANSDSLTISATDTIYTHPDTAGNKHIPTGGSSGQILRYGGSSGTAAWATPNTTSVWSMTSVGSVTAGTATTIDTSKFSGGSFTRGAFSGGSFTQGTDQFVGGSLVLSMDSTDTKKCVINFDAPTFTQGTDTFVAATHAADTFTAAALQSGFYSAGSPTIVDLPERTQVSNLWTNWN